MIDAPPEIDHRSQVLDLMKLVKEQTNLKSLVFCVLWVILTGIMERCT